LPLLEIISLLNFLLSGLTPTWVSKHLRWTNKINWNKISIKIFHDRNEREKLINKSIGMQFNINAQHDANYIQYESLEIALITRIRNSKVLQIANSFPGSVYARWLIDDFRFLFPRCCCLSATILVIAQSTRVELRAHFKIQSSKSCYNKAHAPGGWFVAFQKLTFWNWEQIFRHCNGHWLNNSCCIHQSIYPSISRSQWCRFICYISWSTDWQLDDAVKLLQL
jgi:hypothetical protein